MSKANGLCMQCLPCANSKTVIYKLFVFGKHCSFYNGIAAISFIIKKRVTNRLHVHTYLVRTASLKSAFYQCYITEPFQHGVMRYSFLPVFSVGVSRK